MSLGGRPADISAGAPGTGGLERFCSGSEERLSGQFDEPQRGRGAPTLQYGRRLGRGRPRRMS
eukprot:14637083-Alexandrium_andersonii.AAC.1